MVLHPQPCSEFLYQAEDLNIWQKRYLLSCCGLIGFSCLFTYQGSPIYSILAGICCLKWALSVHELMHLPQRSLNWLLTVPFCLFAPLALPYSALRRIHLRHHQYSGTSEDPEFFLMGGTIWQAAFLAFWAAEVELFQWLQEGRWQHQMLFPIIFQLCLFVVLCSVNPIKALGLALFLRAIYGAAQIVFHRILHQIEVEQMCPKWLVRTGEAVLGKDYLAIVLYHTYHHRYPLVSASALGSLTEKK